MMISENLIYFSEYFKERPLFLKTYSYNITYIFSVIYRNEIKDEFPLKILNKDELLVNFFLSLGGQLVYHQSNWYTVTITFVKKVDYLQQSKEIVFDIATLQTITAVLMVLNCWSYILL